MDQRQRSARRRNLREQRLLPSGLRTEVATAFLPADLANAPDFVPSTARSYKVDDVLIVLNHVYVNEPKSKITITLTVHVETTAGEPVGRFREEVSSSERSQMVPPVTRVPLRTPSRGQYRLMVEVHSRIRSRQTSRRN